VARIKTFHHRKKLFTLRLTPNPTNKVIQVKTQPTRTEWRINVNGNVVGARVHLRVEGGETVITKRHISDPLLENQWDFKLNGRKKRESLFVNVGRSTMMDFVCGDINKVVILRPS
jgi:hypothetical protein